MSGKLNPIQQKIAAGMSPIVAFFSEKTCGEPCWEAREDICRCSCLGKNHGCMRSETGVRPQRTAKIDGYRYVLKATCVQNTSSQNPSEKQARHDMYEEMLRLNRAHGEHPYGSTPNYWRSWDTNVKGAPARIRNASKSQMNWQELTSYRDTIAAIKKSGHYCTSNIMDASPQLLWVREDVVEKEESQCRVSAHGT